ncbi:unnamed protein product [Onchocerca flexuosa]|uniref:Dzip-like_N domain-containing protein n=1 Tax=Onchocerca flexuosa TaxID=387005 RepID=A0A183HLM3_9BILA|nr:unnamed protein product [Onchocerca flexuosa]
MACSFEKLVVILFRDRVERLFESNLIEGVCCDPNMPLYGARLVYSRHISHRNLSSLPDTFKPFKLLNRIISYIDDVTGATEIREAHTILKQNEKKLQDAQALRREKRGELDALQIRMKQIHSELDRYSRGDDK